MNQEEIEILNRLVTTKKTESVITPNKEETRIR